MVGLKTFWITISALFLLAACVPQSKQTECKSNEAFNASLRTCVPVVGGPSSFINVSSFAPVSSITKYKNDASTITFEVSVSNPYNQSYSIAWERVFNGTSVSMCSNAPTCSFPASLLGTVLGEVGTHVLIAKIKDGNGSTVDSHNFEIRIVDLPKPVINSASLNPPAYAPGPYYPTSPRVQFSFQVKNNNATMSATDNYRTVWTVLRDGTLIYTESDSFSSFSPSGTNSAYLGASPTPYFNPATLGTGSYIIRATVQNDVPGEIVAEQQWSLIVQDPPLSPVIARPIYEASTTPAWNTTVNAYHGVAYNEPAGVPYNFEPVGGTTQGNFCVRFQDADGSIPGDGEFIRVDYYLDGVTLIYQGSTTIVDNTVCLSDAAAATLSSVVFTNTTPSESQPHTLVARVYDEYLDKEYTSAELTSGQGTYPLTWNFNVKPQNAGPIASFGTSMSCTSNGSLTKSGCTVASDTNFTVGLNFLSDDFYTVAANEANLNYSFRLYRNGTVIQTCDKATAGADGSTDAAGPEYTCVVNVPSYDINGPIDVTTQTYEIRAELLDDGSPLTTTDAASKTYRWQLNVTESNSAPVVSSFTSNSPVNEGATLTFNIDVDDVNRDNFGYQVQYCKDDAVADPTCTNSAVLSSGSVTRNSNALTNTVNVNYAVPEDFLLNLPLIPCNNVARNAACTVRFRAVITDTPVTAAPLTGTSSLLNVSITNINPAPVFNELAATPSPVVASPFNGTAFVGIPFTFSAVSSGVISDGSAVAAERALRYQWYSRNGTSVTTWTAIDGATSATLTWTPSLIKEANLGTDNPINLMLCVEDLPSSVVATPVNGTSECNDANPWIVTVENNVATVENLDALTAPLLSGTLAKDATDETSNIAVWYSAPSTFNSVSSTQAFIASVDINKNINIKRALVTNEGEIIPDSAELLAQFSAFESSAASTVKDLSLVGTADSLYLAYNASESLAPFTFYPQVRRIDIANSKIAPNLSQGKLGFSYTGIVIDNTLSVNPGEVVVTNPADGTAPKVQFSPTGGITGRLDIVTPLGTEEIPFDDFPNDPGTICSNCTADTMAANLVTIINTNYGNLMGLSAVIDTPNTDTVIISGSLAMDYLDLSGTVTQAFTRTADQVGDIFIHGTKWYLPFIDLSLGGSYNGKISFLSGDLDLNLAGTATLDAATGIANLDLLPAATKFSTSLVGSDLYIALITKSGSQGKLYNISMTDYSLTGSADVMAPDALTDIEVSASSSRVFVKAYNLTDIKFSAFTPAPAVIAGSTFLISSATNVDAATRDIFNVSDLSSSRILAYGNEARIIGASRGTTANEYKLYVGKIFFNITTWSLSCGDCDRITSFDQFVSPYVKIGVAPIRAKVAADPLYRLASGGTGNENIKDVLFTGFAQMDDATAPTVSNPNLGIFNMENESINSDVLHVGPSPDEDTGLFRGPLLKN